MAKKLRKHNYLIGFAGEKQVVYGKDEDLVSQWVHPMTPVQAKKAMQGLGSGEKRVFKLVEVDVDKECFKFKIRKGMMAKEL